MSASPRKSTRALLLLAAWLVAASAAADDEALARSNYLLHCASCHMVNGRGLAGAVPDLHQYLGRFAADPRGRAFPARVPGASGAPISDAELAGVLNWILRTMNADQIGPDFVPYSAAEVGGYRRDPLVDVEPARRSLLRDIGYAH